MKTPLLTLCRNTLLWSPLVTLPLILNIRWMALNEPNEGPKWVVLVVLGLLLASAGLLGGFVGRRTEKGAPSVRRGKPWVPPLVGIFFLALALGVFYAVNPGWAANRFCFWAAAGLVGWSVAVSVWEPGYLSALRWSLAAGAGLLATGFWHGFLVDFSNPEFNAQVKFSPVGHFNFTADVLVILIPLLTWAVWTAPRWPLRLILVYGLASGGFMLIASGSLGGMGGIAVGALLALIWGGLSRWLRPQQHPFDFKPPNASRAFFIIVLILGVGLSGRWLFASLPENFKAQVLTRAEWWQAPGSVNLAENKNLPPLAPFWMAIQPFLGARTPMWAATSGMIAEHPWRGWGTGSFIFEYPAFDKRYDLFKDPETLGVKMKTNPHNLFLQLASENGLPVAVLFYGLFGWLLIRVMQKAWREPAAFWLCGVWALWAAGLDAQVNHVFFNPASLFMAAVLLGLLYGGLTDPRASPLTPDQRASTHPLIASAGLTFALYLASYPLTWFVSEFYVSQGTQELQASKQTSYRQRLTTWVTARRWSPSNPNALYGLATLTYNEKHFTSSESYLKGFLKLVPHHGAGLNLLSSIQANQGQLDEAEQTLEHALQLEPDAAQLRENLEELRKAKAARAVPEQGAPVPGEH